jgi:uncharacterized protein YdeI (YjbR/CyaY-like superfamily)
MTPARGTTGGVRLETPRAFRTVAALRSWFGGHGRSATSLVIRCFKVHAAHRGIGYREALDEALCVGWIDGVRRAFDEDSFTVRFTPRKPRSAWSAVNIRRVEELRAEGRMQAAGLEAWERRNEHPGSGYSIRARVAVLPPAFERHFRSNDAAWAFFEAQAPSYRRDSVYWVTSAVRDETRRARLERLIAASERGAPVSPLLRVRPAGPSGPAAAPGNAARAGRRKHR